MTQDSNALPTGSLLQEYSVEAVLGTGGFGITYKAKDTHLDTWVAIKEYFPVEWAYRGRDGVSVNANAQGQMNIPEVKTTGYEWGLNRFLDEARVLARVQHPYVVRVRRYFRANGTAYIVMDYEEGEPLSALLRREETLSEADLRGLLEEVLPALDAVHQQGYLHRDIKPSNLYIRSRDGCVMLIDFGAARQSLSRRSKSVTGLVTPGYSPPEQYVTRSDRYGPWTDIYALGAVLYRCVTGKTPTEAPDRQMWDTLVPAVEAGADRYEKRLLEVVDQALAMRPEDRFQSIVEMQAALAIPIQLDSQEKPSPSPAVSKSEPLPLPIQAEEISVDKPNSLLPPFKSRLLRGEALDQSRFEPSLPSLKPKPGKISEELELASQPPLKPQEKSQEESPQERKSEPSTPPFKAKRRRLHDAIATGIDRAEVPSPSPVSGSESMAEVIPSDQPETVVQPVKSKRHRQRDIVLSGALVALLVVLGGLIYGIYKEYQISVEAIESSQREQASELARRAAQQQAQLERRESQRQEAMSYVEQARQAISQSEWAKAQQFLDRAQAVDPDNSRIPQLQQQLMDAQRSRPEMKTEVEPRVDMRLVQIEGSCFQMGSPETQAERYSNEAQHQVCVKDFWLGQYEVTNAQYRRFKPDHDSGSYRNKTLNGDDQPVVDISWGDAVAYAEWLSEQTGKHYRLPTEAEWEYATKAQTATIRFWGNEAAKACQYANVADEAAQRHWGAESIHGCNDGHSVTAPVGSYEPNAFQLYDMLGNVSEWTCSEYNPQYQGRESRCSDKEPTEGRRVVRGGSWDDPPRLVRSTDRNGREPNTRDNDLGFRLVRVE